MKIKSWLKYLIYLIVIVFIMILREYFDGKLYSAYYRYEYGAIFFYIAISLLLGVCIGLLLGLEHFIIELGKGGRWKIDIPKITLLGIPSLYFSLTYLWIFSDIQFLQDIVAYPLRFFMRFGSGYISLFQMILGYVVITSFLKYKS